MKKIFLLLMVPFLYLSCSKDSDTEDVTLELLPVSEVELPNNFHANSENIITVKFVRPTDCYAFNQFYYESTDTESTIAVETTVFHYNNGGCMPLQSNNVATQHLKFRPENTGEYTLRFWQGKDENGDDLFLTYDIIVE
nr:hypothetical protein [uncultured Flavobacterium sp.]